MKPSFWAAAGLLVALVTGATAPGSARADLKQDLNDFWLERYGDEAAGQIGTGPLDAGTYPWQRLAKALPDECFDGIGNPYPPGPPCAQGQEKVNQAYVFGLTATETDLWFGTAANMLCMVAGGDVGLAEPHENRSWVCEYGASQVAANPPPGLPLPGLGDWRQPRIYRYSLATKRLTDIAPATGPGAELLNQTYGLRAAANLRNVILLAGPNLDNTAINLFAYRKDGAFLGARSFPGFGNVRDMIVADEQIYMAVQVNSPGGDSGAVLRWVGDVANPFEFIEVGTIPDHAAGFLAEHDGRLFVSTWFNLGATLTAPASPNGIYMSPPIPPGGFDASSEWEEVFNFGDYDNDPIVALSYSGGAIASFDGYLYWGSINFPMSGLIAALVADQLGIIDLDRNGNGQLDLDEIAITALGTFRPISIFRGKDFGTPGEHIELVYGSPIWPSYNALEKTYTVFPLEDHVNNLPNPLPLSGLAGFGNFFNAYTWTMKAHRDLTTDVESLFVGTFDWSYLAAQGFIDLITDAALPPASPVQGAQVANNIALPPIFPGADLMRFDTADQPASPVSIAGVGNITNYGVRTMASGQKNLYIGTANAMNLLTDPNDPLPQGGWELIEVGEPQRLRFAPIADNVPIAGPWGLAIMAVCTVLLGGLLTSGRQRNRRSL